MVVVCGVLIKINRATREVYIDVKRIASSISRYMYIV